MTDKESWQTIGNNNVKHLLTSLRGSAGFTIPYLFVGPKGVGKFTLAKELSGKILGSEVSTHPDLVIFDTSISSDIEALRSFIERLSFTPVAAENIVAIIDGVDNLSTAAHNAMLKTLEEPPRKAKIILVSHSVNLPATLFSRCVVFNFTRLIDKDLEAYMKLNGMGVVDKYILAAAGGSVGRLVEYMASSTFKKEVLLPAENIVAVVDKDIAQKILLISELGAVESSLLREILVTVIELMRGLLNKKPGMYKQLLKVLESLKMLDSNVHKKLVLQNILLN